MRSDWVGIVVLFGSWAASAADLDTSTIPISSTSKDKDNKFGDQCDDDEDCSYEGGQCNKELQPPTCNCHPDFPASNHYDKCGKELGYNESCTFSDQCKGISPNTDCRDGRCLCYWDKVPHFNTDGGFRDCVAAEQEEVSTRYVDPTMIGVLVGLALMFVIMCVVLRLFSKARWRENRSIFNTPNPRLMNVSLLRDSKLLHSAGERRPSRASIRGPSRQPSMASLRPTSPSASLAGSRRGSRGSNASLSSVKSAKSPSAKSPRSPTKPVANSAKSGSSDNVTIEMRQPRE